MRTEKLPLRRPRTEQAEFNRTSAWLNVSMLLTIALMIFALWWGLSFFVATEKTVTVSAAVPAAH